MYAFDLPIQDLVSVCMVFCLGSDTRDHSGVILVKFDKLIQKSYLHSHSGIISFLYKQSVYIFPMTFIQFTAPSEM